MSHISREHALTPDQRKKENQTTLSRLFKELEKSLSVRKTGDILEFSSETGYAKLADKNSYFSAHLKLQGKFNPAENNNRVIVELTRQAYNGEQRIGHRIYFLDEESGTLYFTSDLDVINAFSRNGIGTALIDADDPMYIMIAQQIQKMIPISKIVAQVADATSKDDSGWTTRSFKNRPGWTLTKPNDGIFTKTFDLPKPNSSDSVLDNLLKKIRKGRT